MCAATYADLFKEVWGAEIEDGGEGSVTRAAAPIGPTGLLVQH